LSREFSKLYSTFGITALRISVQKSQSCVINGPFGVCQSPDWFVVRQFIAVNFRETFFDAQSIALLQTLVKTNFTVYYFVSL